MVKNISKFARDCSIEIENARIRFGELSNKNLQRVVNTAYENCKFYENKRFESKEDELYFCKSYSLILIRKSMVVLREKGFVTDSGYNEEKIKSIKTTKRDLYEVNSIIDKCINVLNREISLIEQIKTLVPEFKEFETREVPYKVRNDNTIYAYTFSNNYCFAYCYRVKADLYFFQEKVKEAIEHFQKAADYGCTYAASNLVYVYTQAEYFDLDQAEYYYNQTNYPKIGEPVPEYNQSRLNASNFFSQALMDNGEYLRALEVLKNLKLAKFYALIERSFKNEIEDKIVFCENKLKEQNVEDIKTTELKKYFTNDVVSRMSDDVKVFINSSLKIFDFIEKGMDESNLVLDYSSVTMPLMKAVESILFKVFIESYLEFLKTEKDIDLGIIDDEIKDKDRSKIRESIKIIEIKTVKKLMASENYLNNKTYYYPNPYFENFCKSVGIVDPYWFIIDLCKKIEKLRKMRNATAHKQRIVKSDAEDCLNFLVRETNLIGILYEKFGAIL